jgi:hypothetical protein
MQAGSTRLQTEAELVLRLRLRRNPESEASRYAIAGVRYPSSWGGCAM